MVRIKFSIPLEHGTRASRSVLDRHRPISGLSVSPDNGIGIEVMVLRKWEGLSLQAQTCSLPCLLAASAFVVSLQGAPCEKSAHYNLILPQGPP